MTKLLNGLSLNKNTKGDKRSKSRSNASRGTKSNVSSSSFDDDDEDYYSDSDDDSSFQPAPPPMPGKQAENSLPPGWTEQTSENGIYYWNFQTGVTTWERPTFTADEDDGFVAPPPAPSDGIQLSNMNGNSGMT